MKKVESFLELAQNYKAVFFDAFGVLKNSQGIIDGVFDILKTLRENNLQYFVITNDASKSPEEMVKAYIHPELGEMIVVDRNISSGLLASEYLKAKVKKGRVAYLGKEASAFYITRAGHEAIAVTEVKSFDEVDAFVFLDDEGFDWFKAINQAVNLVRQTNVPVLVANPDKAYPIDKQTVGIAVGSLADVVETITGKTFLRFGKPDTQIMAYAFQKARAIIPDLKRNEALMVGDTLHTDILAANKFRMNSCLVLSGNTQKHRYQSLVEVNGIIPDFVVDSVCS